MSDPMTPTDLTALVALAAKWRDEADGVTAMGYSQQGDRMRDCADELESALAGLPREAPPALVRYGVTWNGDHNQPLLTPMWDGYWTPWHIAMGRPSMPQPEDSPFPPRPALATPAAAPAPEGAQSTAAREALAIIGALTCERSTTPAYQCAQSADDWGGYCMPCLARAALADSHAGRDK